MQTECHSFADPYVEHDSLTLILDLILLKRGVYRHLLYNRGIEPRRLGPGTGSAGSASSSQEAYSSNKKNKQREKMRWLLVLRLGGAVVAVDAFIRWVHLNPNLDPDVSPWSAETTESFFLTLIGCFAETIAFHAGVILACVVILNLLDWVQKWRRPSSRPKSKNFKAISGIRQEFRYSLIPLTIFYSSLIKLFLLLLLSIWRPTISNSSISHHQSWNGTSYKSVFINNALEILDDDKLDREWVVRNVLGGMAAGFGLRVILDCHPIFTTIIILVGWAVKTAVASLISGWIGRDKRNWEDWLAYSIP